MGAAKHVQGEKPGEHGGTIPLYGMLDVWMALYGTSHPGFDEFYAKHGYAESWARLLAAVREHRTMQGEPQGREAKIHGDLVTMRVKEWRRVTDELMRLRTEEAAREDVQGEPSDDYEAGYAEGFHHGRSTPREGTLTPSVMSHPDPKVQAALVARRERVLKRSRRYPTYAEDAQYVGGYLDGLKAEQGERAWSMKHGWVAEQVPDDAEETVLRGMWYPYIQLGIHFGTEEDCLEFIRDEVLGVQFFPGEEPGA